MKKLERFTISYSISGYRAFKKYPNRLLRMKETKINDYLSAVKKICNYITKIYYNNGYTRKTLFYNIGKESLLNKYMIDKLRNFTKISDTLYISNNYLRKTSTTKKNKKRNVGLNLPPIKW